ncbi:MAG: multidrug effflux MFS transporter [Gammaproteobacteria bacterium]|nr:multidrug effflux MFS transporter [Gammaproteobacteria bacterium]
MHKKTFIFLIVLIFTFGQIATDLYLPSLSHISESFYTNTSMVQLSITIYIISSVISQPIYGVASDGFGRRPSLIFGISLAVVGTIICLLAKSIFVFLIGRFVQGLGAGVGSTVCRAIMRDRFTGHDLIVTNSHLAVSNIALMITAPVLGGYIAYYINWHACFVLLLLLALFNLMSVLYILPETSQKHGRHNLKPGIIITNFSSLLQSKNFLLYSFCSFMTFGGVMAWTTAGPVILHKIYKVSSIHIGWVYFFVGMMYIFGNICNRNLVYKFGLNNMIKTGFSIQLLTGLILATVFLLNYTSIFALIIPVGFYMFGSSLIAPNASVGAINDFTDISGTASALLSMMQNLGAVIFSLIMILSPTQNILPVAICFSSIGFIALLVNYIVKYEHISVIRL